MSSKGKQVKPTRPQPAAKPAAPPVQPPAKARSGLWVFVICTIISLIFYGNTLQNGYSMDDEYVTLNQKNVEQGIAGIPAIFTSHYSVNQKQKYEYRPMVLTSFALEYQLFGRNPAASHFINILLYALTCFMLYKVLSKTFPQQYWLAWLATLIFLIHPLHSEVVTSLKNRDEMLTLLFVFCSWSYFLSYVHKRSSKYIVLGVLFMMMAALTKISCLPFLLLIPFAIIYTQPIANKKRAMLFSFVIAFVMGACYNLFKMLMLDNAGEEVRELLFFENPLYAGNYSLMERLLMALGTFGFYVKMMLVPYPLVVYYGYNTLDGFSFGLYHVMALLMIGLLVWVFWKQRQNKPMVLGAIIFVACISMFVNLVVPAVGIVAERFAFAASAGFALLFSALLLHFIHAGQSTGSLSFAQLKPAVKFIFLVLVLASAIVVIPRNKNWNSTISIYTADIEKVPQSAKLNMLIASYCVAEVSGNVVQRTAIQNSQSVDSAVTFFRHALAVYPQYAAANNNLSTVYLTARRNLDSSGFYALRALKADSLYPEAHSNTGLYYEGKAGIEMEKASWIEYLLENDSAKLRTGYAGKLDTYDHYFEDLSQMKKMLVTNITDISTGKYGADGNKIMNSTITFYCKRMFGQQPALFPQQYPSAVANTYRKLAMQNKFERVPEVTDSITAVHFNPIIKTLIGNESSSYADRTLYDATRKKAEEYRQQTFKHYNTSLKLKTDGDAFNRILRTLDRWKMYDEMVEIHEYALKADNTKKYSLEFNLANIYVSKNDYKNAAVHAIKGIEEMNKVLNRLEQCRNDFSAAGNGFASVNFDNALKNMKQKTAIFATKMASTLRQAGLEAEAVQVEQKYNTANKGA